MKIRGGAHVPSTTDIEDRQLAYVIAGTNKGLYINNDGAIEKIGLTGADKTTVVRPVGTATDEKLPTELAVATVI
jgi:hypothetical protein